MQRHADVTCFDELKDVVFIAFIFQGEFIFERELCLGVVAHLKLDLLADFGGSAELDVLREVEVGGSLLCHGQRRVAAALVFHTERHVGGTLQLDVDGVTAENLVEHLAANIDRRYQGVSVAGAHSRLAAIFPIVFDGLFLNEIGILLLCHDVRLAVGEVADFADEDILPGYRVVLYGAGDVIRIFKLDAGLLALTKWVIVALRVGGVTEADQ